MTFPVISEGPVSGQTAFCPSPALPVVMILDPPLLWMNKMHKPLLFLSLFAHWFFFHIQTYP